MQRLIPPGRGIVSIEGGAAYFSESIPFVDLGEIARVTVYTTNIEVIELDTTLTDSLLQDLIGNTSTVTSGSFEDTFDVSIGTNNTSPTFNRDDLSLRS